MELSLLSSQMLEVITLASAFILALMCSLQIVKYVFVVMGSKESLGLIAKNHDLQSAIQVMQREVTLLDEVFVESGVQPDPRKVKVPDTEPEPEKLKWGFPDWKSVVSTTPEAPAVFSSYYGAFKDIHPEDSERQLVEPEQAAILRITDDGEIDADIDAYLQNNDMIKFE